MLTWCRSLLQQAAVTTDLLRRTLLNFGNCEVSLQRCSTSDLSPWDFVGLLSSALPISLCGTPLVCSNTYELSPWNSDSLLQNLLSGCVRVSEKMFGGGMRWGFYTLGGREWVFHGCLFGDGGGGWKGGGLRGASAQLCHFDSWPPPDLQQPPYAPKFYRVPSISANDSNTL